MATAATYAAIKTALDAELATLYPAATWPVQNAIYAGMIEEYSNALYAAAKLTERAHDSYSTVGVSFAFRDASSAARAAASLGVKLGRAGFSTDVGTPVIADIRDIGENIGGSQVS